MNQLPFRLLVLVGNLLAGKTVYQQCLVVDMSAVPHAALLVQLAARVVHIDSAHAYNRVRVRPYPACLHINSYHSGLPIIRSIQASARRTQ